MKESAVTVKTRFAETNGRTIAYRSIGDGAPLILANRFRGILDSWDPLFLDSLACNHRVITFDYSGFGLSTGEPATIMAGFSKDVVDLAGVLGLGRFVMGGWSFGGWVAQTVATAHADLVSHLILIGTRPPGRNAHPIEPVFYETAWKPENDFEDEVVLFFEPASEESRKAALRSHERIAGRTSGLSIPVPLNLLEHYGKGGADFEMDPIDARTRLSRADIPILVVSGDHEICFPVENWYALTRTLPTMQLIVIPQAGHGPHHQHPEMIAEYIASFVRQTTAGKSREESAHVAV
jgi:pimeloyl-ACP methyl ester carboxylesterase